jgi:hypothetical protein
MDAQITEIARASLRHDLDSDGTSASSVIEVDQHDLLPGSEREPAFDYRNGL